MTKKEGNYVFPNFLATAMAKVDLRTQYEASMLSMSFILIGLIVTIFYMFIYVEIALWYKIFLVFNGVAGFFFISSMLVTTYQQYNNYLATIKFQKELKGGYQNEKKEIN